MKDRAYKVRKLVVNSFKKLAAFLDDNYLNDCFFKDAVKTSMNTTDFYSYRITSIYALEQLVIAIKAKEKVKDTFFKTVSKLLEDQCINIRQVSAKVLIDVYRAKLFPDL